VAPVPCRDGHRGARERAEAGCPARPRDVDPPRLVEIDAGDTFAYDTAGMAAQHEHEARAADRIFGILPADQASDFRRRWDEFEERRTPESRFAAAIDRFQPVLLNCATEGAAWKRHRITEDRVRERNAPIAAGSVAFWEEVQRRIREAVVTGHLGAAG